MMALDKLVDSTQLDSDLTSVANAIRTKSGGSSQLAFPAGFVSEIQAIPSGGGATALIASGTYTGAGAIAVDIPVGKKMPKKDFLFHLWAPNGTEFVNDSYYKVNQFYALCRNMEYNLSNNADPCAATTLVYNKVGTTNIHVKSNWYLSYIRSTSTFFTMQANNGYNRIKRDANGFYIKVQNYNAAWYFVSGLVYNWEVLYIGSDAANDIVEVP
jgi:hypothetical protein